MKNIRNTIIILLIASNAFFVGAYTKKQDEVNEAKLVAEKSREMAVMAQMQAEENAAMAEQMEAKAQEQVMVLQEQLEGCQSN